MDAPNATSLHIRTLVGAWNGASQGNRACIEQVANRSYEDIETELLELASHDDAPALKIGALWKAKASLELLNHNRTPPGTAAEIRQPIDISRGACNVRPFRPVPA